MDIPSRAQKQTRETVAHVTMAQQGPDVSMVLFMSKHYYRPEPICIYTGAS
jgi:hypothetical protein